MSSDTSHTPIYRKIEETILRNDFRSAEHLIEKYREELTQDEIQTLQTLAEQKQKANVREDRRRQRQRRWDRCFGHHLKRHPLLMVLLSKDGFLFALIGLLVILGIINTPYMAPFYYHLRSGIGNPQRALSGDIITTLMLLIASVFCGVASTTPECKKRGEKGFTVASIIIALMGLFNLLFIIRRLIHGGY